MRGLCSSLCALTLLLPAFALGQDTYKIEPLKQGPPEGFAAAIKAELSVEGYRILTGDGKPFAEIWLRKAIPASAKPNGPQATIQFPILAEGELLGALRFASEGHDYRDQSISPGMYTLRYGLQPVNGDHLGVSPFRDYALLVPAAKDKSVAIIPRETLEDESAESAGTSHPAVLMLFSVEESADSTQLTHNEEKKTWGANLPLALAVKGEKSTAALKAQLIIVGGVME